MASYSPLLNNLAFLVLLSALISLYLVGCGFSIDFLGRMSKLFQTEEHCAQAYRASHADYISGRAGDSVPPMPTIKWLGAFWLSTLVGLGLSLAVVLLAWVTRNNKILGGSKNPPKHFTLDNFAESVAKSNLFVAWGLICTIIGLVSSITYSESLDTRPFSAGPYGTGIDGNPRFTFRTWVESDLAEYNLYSNRTISAYFAANPADFNARYMTNGVYNGQPFHFLLSPTAWGNAQLADNTCVPCPQGDSRIPADGSAAPDGTRGCTATVGLDDCSPGHMRSRRLVAKWVYTYVKSETDWCGTTDARVYGLEMLTSAVFLVDAIIYLLGHRNNMADLLSGNAVSFWCNALACCVGMWALYAQQVPHNPYDMIMLSSVFRWCRLFAVASHVAKRSAKKGPVVRRMILASRLVFLIFTFAQFTHFAEWPCEAIVRESKPTGVFAMTASCDTGFRSFWTSFWYVFVTLSTVGYGDHFPATILGQLICMFLIIFMFILLPGWVDELGDASNDKDAKDATDQKNANPRQSSRKAVGAGSAAASSLELAVNPAKEPQEADPGQANLVEACALLGIDAAEAHADPKLAMMTFIAKLGLRER